MRIYQVDSFTSEPFRGNPAGVCPLDGPQPDDWMRSVAAEMNLSETAFFFPEGDAYRLRWFTPKVEVRLCGHATLASAHVLYEEGLCAPGAELRFNTLSGLLTARRSPGWVLLNFPVRPVHAVTEPAGLSKALGAKPVFVGRYDEDVLVELASEQEVAALTPDIPALAAVECRGITVTARASRDGVDFVSRFFAPRVGISEDPVTGSSHTALTPYWAAKLGKEHLTAYQCSARGGTLRLGLLGERVEIGGQAVTVLKAELVA